MSASPYKSRLFNLLNRQSIKVKTRLGRSLRQLQNTAALGLQILLYPIYFLVQSARAAQQTLSHSLHHKQLPFSTPVEEEIPYPLERVLEKVDNTPELASAIATDIDSRKLVFVSPEQEILDIIPPTKQRRLDGEIKTAIANYYYDIRLRARFSRKTPGLMPQKQSKVLAPIRWFWQLMSWEQQGEVALSINLFGESSLPVPPPPPKSPHQILVAIDDKLASFDSEKQPPEATYQAYIWRLYWLIYGAIDHYFGTPDHYEPIEGRAVNLKLEGQTSSALPGEEPETPPRKITGNERRVLPSQIKAFSEYLQHRTKEWLGKQESNEVLDSIREDPFTIAALIKAAIDHYFRPSQDIAITAAKDEIVEDPWLSALDLYPEESVSSHRPEKAQPQERASIDGKIEEILKKLPQAKQVRKKGIRQKVNRALAEWGKPKAIEKKTVTPSPLVVFEQSPTALLSVEEETDLTSFQAQEKSLNSFDPPYTDPIFDDYENYEWVETKSVSSSYVKHPLERILEILDTIVLRVEDTLIKLWRGMKAIFKKNKRKKG